MQAALYSATGSEKPDPTMEYKLALKYQNGDGVPQDFTKSMFLREKAADGGVPDAQYDLAVMYSVRKDYVTAYMWADVSASKGYPEAIQLRDMLQKMMTPNAIKEGHDLSNTWSAAHP